MSKRSRKPLVDPRVVGGTYLDSYWGTTYRVDAITFVGKFRHLESITVTDDAGSRTHCTSWDRRDRVVSEPSR